MRLIIISVFISVIIFICSLTGYHNLYSVKIGYVRTGILLEKYNGMKDANKTFKDEYNLAKTNLDTLKKRYDALKMQEGKLGSKNNATWGYNIGMAERDLTQYNESFQQQMQSRQKELLSNILRKVNSYIESYGEKKHYKLILGTTEDGSILYGNKGDDLTEEIINALNTEYIKKMEK